MAKVTKSNVDVELKITLELNESEVRALDGIFGYNVDGFLKMFYEKMGKSYLEDHESGVRSLHETIRQTVAGPLSVLNDARKAMNAALVKN